MTKTYLRGSVREKTFDNGSSLVNFSINVTDFISGQSNKSILDYADEKGWVQLTMSSKKEIDSYGNTHSIFINEFKPKPQNEDAIVGEEAAVDEEEKSDGELPF